MAHSKIVSSFAAGSILLAQLLAYGPVSAQTPQLIKVKDNTAVYLITGLTRHAFPLSGVYTSWYGTNFDSVVTVSAEQLASYTLSKNVLFKSGTLIKIQTDPKVYSVLNDDGALEWIPSEEEFKKRGLSFEDIRDVPDTLFSDYRMALASDFATPQNAPATEPTSTSTPILEAPKPASTVLVITNVSTTSFVSSDSSTQAKFIFSTSVPAVVTIDYAPAENATSTVTLASATEFTKTIPVFGGVDYRYSITAVAADGARSVINGSFVSYSDIVGKPISNLVPTGTSIAQAQVFVGGFSVTNNSSSSRTITQMGFRFDSESAVTNSVAKTLQIVRLKSDNSVGDMIVEKNIPSGTGITNGNNLQNLSLEEVVAPGEVKRYGLVLKNLDQINLGLVSPSDTFVPSISRLDFASDTSVNLNKNPLATLIYIK